MNKCAYLRGKWAENNVLHALELLKEEGRIAGFYITKRWSRENKSGIDAVVFLNDRTIVKRQIKSSQMGIQKHLRKQRRYRTKIGVILGDYPEKMSFETYKENVFLNVTNSDD